MNKSDKPKSYYSASWLAIGLVIFCTIWFVGLWHAIKAAIRLFGG